MSTLFPIFFLSRHVPIESVGEKHWWESLVLFFSPLLSRESRAAFTRVQERKEKVALFRPFFSFLEKMFFHVPVLCLGNVGGNPTLANHQKQVIKERKRGFERHRDPSFRQRSINVDFLVGLRQYSVDNRDTVVFAHIEDFLWSKFSPPFKVGDIKVMKNFSHKETANFLSPTFCGFNTNF